MRRFGFLFLIVLLCAWSWGAPAPVAFVTNGSNGSSEGIPTSPNAFYDSTNNTTWVFWDGTPDNTNRYAYAATYNHTTLTRSSDYEIIQNNLTSTDIHGTPGAVMDQYGYVHVFCCSHNSDASYAISTNPHDPSAWTACTSLSAAQYTYYAPVLYSGKIYLFSTTKASGSQDAMVQVGTPNSNGSCISSWSSVVQITDFFHSSSGGEIGGWIANPAVIGASICFGFVYADQTGNPWYGANLYYGCYRPSDGAFTDITGATVIAAGSLPFNKATADADFAVATTPAGHATTMPAQAVDGNGNIHVIYADGVITNNGQSSPNGLFTVYEAVWNGSTWSTGNAIGPILNSFWYNLAIVTTSTQVQFFWVDWAGRVNVSSRLLVSNWGSIPDKALVWPAVFPWNLTAVWNATGNARVVFGTNNTTGGSSSLTPNSLMYLYGDSGFIP